MYRFYNSTNKQGKHQKSMLRNIKIHKKNILFFASWCKLNRKKDENHRYFKTTISVSKLFLK